MSLWTSQSSVKRRYYHHIVIFLALLFFGFFTVLFHRFFFYFDEWTLLKEYIQSPWQSLLVQNHEHLRPVFKLFYFGELRLFGLRYELFMACSMILHLLVGFFVYRITIYLTYKPVLAIIGFLVFTLHPAAYEALFWGSGQDVLLTMLLGLWSLEAYILNNKTLQAIVLSTLAMFCWAPGFIFPLILFLLSVAGKKAERGARVLFGLVVILYIVTYLLFGRLGLSTNNQHLVSIETLLSVGPFLLRSLWDGIVGQLFFEPSAVVRLLLVIVLIVTGYWTVRQLKHQRKVFFLSLLCSVGLEYLLIAPFRAGLPVYQQIAPRYQYLTKTVLVIALAVFISLVRERWSKSTLPVSRVVASVVVVFTILVLALGTMDLAYQWQQMAINHQQSIAWVLSHDNYQGIVDETLAPGLTARELREIYQQLE